MEERIDQIDRQIRDELSTWDIVNILWAFNSINFDKEGELMSAIKSISKYSVLYMLNEFSKVELIMILQVYLQDFTGFTSFYIEEEQFFTVLMNQVELYIDLFNSNELSVIIYLITTNSTLLKNNIVLNGKLMDKKKELDNH